MAELRYGTVGARAESALSTNRVLRNTYLLLGATLGFSALMAGTAMALDVARLNVFIVLGGFFGLSFLVNRTQNSAWGLLSVFALTGFMGFTLGPILNMYLKFLPNGAQVITTALAVTSVTFVGLSAYAVKSGRDFSFMGGFLTVGILGAFVLGIVAMIFKLTALSLVVSGMFVLAMAALILYETSNIIRGGETNYIAATVTLYVAFYNLFTSLLHLMGFASSDD
jgi:modulator of FtsH protease